MPHFRSTSSILTAPFITTMSISPKLLASGFLYHFATDGPLNTSAVIPSSANFSTIFLANKSIFFPLFSIYISVFTQLSLSLPKSTPHSSIPIANTPLTACSLPISKRVLLSLSDTEKPSERLPPPQRPLFRIS